MSDIRPLAGPLTGLRILELADEKGPVLRQASWRPRGRCGQNRTPGWGALPAYRAIPQRHPRPGAQSVFLVLQYVQTRHYPQSANHGWPPAFRTFGGDIGRHSGNLPAGLPDVAEARLRGPSREKPQAHHVRPDTLRPDRPVAGPHLQ